MVTETSETTTVTILFITPDVFTQTTLTLAVVGRLISNR